MKLYSIQASLLLLLVLSVTACKEKIETPFSGNDNRILELSLTDAKEHTYVASLADENTWQIMIPSDADLSNAKVSYRISDQAQIMPKPTEIDNWNNDQAFQVRSYSGERRTYLVQIIREYVEVPNSVKLTTDEDVKAFVAKGVSHIEGDLIVGALTGKDSISNIDALTSLEKVDYDIIINPTYKGTDLSGLRNVKEAGGIFIRSQKLKDATFKHLNVVYGNVDITGDALKQIGMPQVTHINGILKITKVAISEFSLPRLETLGAFNISFCDWVSTISLRSLKSISGNLNIEKLNKLGTLTAPKLETINGNMTFNNLHVFGVLSLNKLVSVENVAFLGVNITELYLNELKRCGELSINATSLRTLIAPHLKEINGNFSLVGCGVSNLNQLGVEKIYGKLSFSNLSNLQDIENLCRQLIEVKEVSLIDVNADGKWSFSNSGVQKINIERCRNVEELILPKVMTKIEIKGDGMMQLKQLIKMSGIEEVSENFIISNYHLATPQEIQILLTKAGEIKVGCSNILSLSFPLLEEAKNIEYNYIPAAYDGKKKEIQAQYAMQKLVAPKLQSVQKMSFNLHDLEMLDMPQLKTIKERLTVQCHYPKDANSVLKNLNGLSALENIKEIQFNNLIVFNDYSFLKKAVANGSLTSVRISGSLYQPSLEDLKAGKFIQE